ncbi:carcinoembryonic antigen-related cell adhesion molecule 6-like isoform X2 [Echeneis naucrates]|uniref:carcinoembryonic antigen-related cell adhesion molecule 6-like isoform X2 n=1 Tax=Echeneis naucrates TaxID=173247 RepID=UPI0011139122|nr:carcinoembryonic antigen-related cell adhesion molecule 6-like isoform X2 [Echeneis naucrates]
MRIESRNLTWTLMLLSGVFCSSGWDVIYGQQRICAVKGSSVVIVCSFSYPVGEKVTTIMWGHDTNFFEGPFVYESKSEKSSKFQYIGDYVKNCSFQINKVNHTDQGNYKFRFITVTNKWTSTAAATLEIHDLKAEKSNGNGPMKEGDSLNLTCVNNCNNSAVSWYKDGNAIVEGSTLHLLNISSINSGTYSCSLTGLSETTSGGINIDVEYGPKNTSVSVRPSMEVEPGSNVTLSCSSDGNPPVNNYTWFKMGDSSTSVGAEHELHFMKVSAAGVEGYYCRAANKHGSQNSSTVTLTVKDNSSHGTSRRNTYIVSTFVAIFVLLIVTIAIAVRRLNKKKRTPETDYEDCNQRIVYSNWPMLDNNQPQEGAQCGEERREIVYAAIDFTKKREPNMEQQMDPHNYDDDVVYRTVNRH